MGGWTAAVYTEEQQARLSVAEDGTALRSAVLTVAERRSKARVVLVGTVHFNSASIALAEEPHL